MRLKKKMKKFKWFLEISVEVLIYILICFNIGTHNTVNFPFVPNGKLMVFRCPNI